MEEDQGAPLLFRCPISMELMVDPTTISTGVTYERKNIEKWFYSYQKSTCPATMQRLDSFDLTPNHTLKRLIDTWRLDASTKPQPPSIPEHDTLVLLLADVESTPFKVSSLKKIQSLVGTSLDVQNDFVRSGGVRVLSRTMSQAVDHEGADFSAFRACEECVGVLHHLPITDADTADTLSKPECTKPMMLILQRGSAEARLHAMIVLQKLSNTKKDWMLTDQEIDVAKSLLELLSDEISTKLSSRALDVMIEIVAASKRNRHRAVEAGAVCVLIELLPDASPHRSEKILMLLNKLCGCPEGRSAFADHGLGVAAVSKKLLRVSELGTKLCVKILFKTCSLVPTERVVGDMMAFGAVRKLFCLLHVDGRSTTKDRALGMIRAHGGAWKQYPCFPCELKEFLKLVRSCQ